ncbi:MAG: hypothetical protein ACRC33_07400, partial [Gemmataceae bacterium]
MHVLAPDILELTRQLSPAVSLALAAAGLALWLFGARTHRFWLALVITVGGGLAGLQIGRDFGVQPLVSGLLMALAAGALSLALARIAVFAAGGVAALVLVKSVANGWNDFVCFLAGGLTGIALYPVWISVLSSTAGTVLTAYGAVSFADRLFLFDSRRWSEQNGPLIDWFLVGWVILGMVVQYTIDRHLSKPAEQPKPKEEGKKKDEKPKDDKDGMPWWHWKS